MRAHTITTKTVGGRGRTKRTLVPGGILALAAALLVWMVVPGSASAHGTHVKAKMSGDQVVGGPGAPNGEGTAKLHLWQENGEEAVCFTVKYNGIESRKGLDVAVYKGKRNENGALQFRLVNEDLKSPIEGRGNCVTGLGPGSAPKKLNKITRNPRRYNVNVKTDKYPDGAIRGQLKKAR
jgi:hypothetical protein